MSEVEHIKGRLIPTGKTINEFVRDAKFETWHSNAREYFDEEYYEKAVEINNEVFTVESQNLDPCDDIFTSTKNSDGTISFEVKYYNGGCGFSEAIEDALKNSI